MKIRLSTERVKQIIKEEFQKLRNEAAKPDFLDLDKDGDKEEPMKKAAKDKKEKVKEAEKPKYAKSQDKEHDDAKDLGAKLAGKLKESKVEEKQIVTEVPQQQTQEVKENNKAWYNTSLYNKLKSKWSK